VSILGIAWAPLPLMRTARSNKRLMALILSHQGVNPASKPGSERAPTSPDISPNLWAFHLMERPDQAPGMPRQWTGLLGRAPSGHFGLRASYAPESSRWPGRHALTRPRPHQHPMKAPHNGPLQGHPDIDA
jgi:hypothetical protein